MLIRWRSVGERGRRDSSVIASERMVRIVVVVDDDDALLVVWFGNFGRFLDVDFILFILI